MNRRQYAFPAAILAVAAIVGIIVLIVNSGGEDGGGDGGAAATKDGGAGTKDGGTANGPCREVPKIQPRQVEKRKQPTLELDPARTYRATVKTSCGTFVIKLDSKRAPITGGSFVTLARRGFYDGLSFHRIAPGFVVQGGDPQTNGTGGAGYTVRERPPKDVVYSNGVVAMAKSADQPAGTSGSQFFVVTGSETGLPPDYALLGKVVSGMDSVKAIEGLASSQDGPPKRPVVMDKVTIAESGGTGSSQ